MKKIIGVAAGAAALAISAPGFAATCSVGNCTITDGALSNDHPIAIQGSDVTIGSIDDEGSFSINSDVTAFDAVADFVFDQAFGGSVPAGFSNLTIEFFQDSTSLGGFMLTDADGFGVDQAFSVTLHSTSDISFILAGEAFLNSGASLPDYDINLSAVVDGPLEMPLPGSIPLLLSGLAGLGFAMQRKKAA